MVSLYVIQGNDQGQRFDFSEAGTTIGRNPKNQVHLRDAEISREHARIEFSDGRYRLLDANSVNGIFVNGRRQKKHTLRNGDQILLGQTLLLFADRPPTDNEIHPENMLVRSDESSELEKTDRPLFQPVASHEADVFHSPVFTGSKDWNPQADAHLKMMYHTTLVTSQTLDIDVLLHRILDLIFEWVEIDRGSIMLFDSETHQLIPKATRLARNRSQDSPEKSPRIVINKSIVGYVLKRREGVLTNDAQTDPRWAKSEQEIREVICVPMLGRYGLVGIIYIDTLNAGDRSESEDAHPTPVSPLMGKSRIPCLNSDHLRLMVAIAHQAALAVEDTRYYREMIQGERLATVGQTVTTLSHHIKNILQGISGGSHLIEMGLEKHNEDLIRQGWDIVERNQARISKLILDMLMFSKEREPAYEMGDINQLVHDVVELMQSRAKELNVELVFKQTTFIPKFYFDVEQIHRAVTNLVTNGIDAAGIDEDKENENEDGKPDGADPELDTLFSIKVAQKNDVIGPDGDRKRIVQLATVYDPDKMLVTILIDDNGPGIPKNRRSTLFRPFYSEKKGRGTGLGLSVVHKVVQEHGGTVAVENSPLGGARFVVTLPFKMEHWQQMESAIS